MTRRSFAQAIRALGPAWLVRRDEGELVGYSLGRIVDAFAERTRQGLIARFPAYAPEDALGPMGRDRKITRGINEPAATYAARQLTWLDDHKRRGNPFALMQQLRGYCGVDMVFRTVDRRGNWYTRAADGTESYLLRQANWDWDGVPASPDWSRFWVILYPPVGTDADPYPLWGPGPTIGASDLWGGAIGTDGYTIGSTATPDEVAGVRAIVREWMPAGTRCEGIILAFDSASFDPATPAGPPLPDGTWGVSAKIAAGVWVRTRLDTARYWRGPE